MALEIVVIKFYLVANMLASFKMALPHSLRQNKYSTWTFSGGYLVNTVTTNITTYRWTFLQFLECLIELVNLILKMKCKNKVHSGHELRDSYTHTELNVAIEECFHTLAATPVCKALFLSRPSSCQWPFLSDIPAKYTWANPGLPYIARWRNPQFAASERDAGYVR